MSADAARRILPSRPTGGWRRFVVVATRRVFWTLVARFSANKLLTYASAIAFQVLIALVALVLLGIALLDILGLRASVWEADILPFFESRFSFQTVLAVESTVSRIFRTGSLGLLVFATLLAIWEVSGAVRAIMGALNEIYDCDEERPTWRRFGTSLWLAVCLVVCLGGSVFAVTLMTRIPGLPDAAGQVLGWASAIVLLSTAVWLRLRYAPFRTRSAGWTSVGSILIIAAWIIASLLFGYYARDVADYRTALGNLAAFLTLTAYLYVSSIIFLTGTQIDEVLRRQAERGHTGLAALTTLPGRDGRTSADSDRPPRRASRRRAAASSRSR